MTSGPMCSDEKEATFVTRKEVEAEKKLKPK
jgi:hypothetical protein